MRQLPTTSELIGMSRWAIKRLRLTPEELKTLGPHERIVIASKTRPEARQLVLRQDRSGLSVRVRGRRWEHHGWEISRRDYRLFLPEEKKRIDYRQIPIVEEYSSLA